ncbi:hypothetical protein HYH03_001354 [Edaphochlamys debaryana]|uniref:Non-specific serine/threonine protein kinase n=1 Tax=Edaphochlamys debaryana TaxID=47281 RepID=A0A835YGM3_9CHLO|nr:hypothetical protein HYH03_001354 [Edaphochlamys debaryana]|eukprot:KAG2500586.1 hypothetical protein HYH03_001354 [Edaphochlamys debaryana]
MAQQIPPHFRPALNPRELPAHRVERLWALHADLTTAPGLAAAAAWLPPAWPHLLQLLSDPHHDVRSAAAPLLGHLGAALACGREPRLAGRLPPGALLDWGLAVLSPGSALPAAQRMTPEAREAALCALHACASALPSPRLEPYAQSLLRLVCGLLEAPATPPRLLGPLMRTLMAALPAAPLAALGQAFGDLADLLCGWALGGGVAEQDRHQVRLVLHALRPQWHSHPDLTASLTANMLGDAAEAAAAAAAAAAASNPSEAAAQAASCLQLAQLLTDILSAASLRPVARLASPSPAVQSGAVHPSQLALPFTAPYGAVPVPHQGPAAPPLPPQPPPALPLALTALLPTRPAADTARHIAQLYPRFLSVLKLLRQTLAGLDASDLAAAGIDLPAGSSAASGGGSGGDRSSGADAAWPGRLCGCVEALAESTASVVAALDARDVEDVWEAVCSSASDGGGSGSKAAAGAGAEGRASLEDVAARLQALTVSQTKPGAEVAVGASALRGDVLGPVGFAAAAAGLRLANVEGASAAAAAALPLGRREVLRLWALQEGLEWAVAALGGAALPQTPPAASTGSAAAAAGLLSGAPGPGPDAVALVGLSARLLRFAEAEPRPPSGSSGGGDGGSGGGGAGGVAAPAAGVVGRVLVSELVLERGVAPLRASPEPAAVAAAARLAQAILSEAGPAAAAAAVDWLLADVSRGLAPTAAAEGGDERAALAAAAFSLAVLQAACSKALLSPGSAAGVEALAWRALRAAMPVAVAAAPETLGSSGVTDGGADGEAAAAAPQDSAPPGLALAVAATLPASLLAALCDAWAAAGLSVLAAATAAWAQPQPLLTVGQTALNQPHSNLPAGRADAALSAPVGAYLRGLHSLIADGPGPAGVAGRAASASAAPPAVQLRVVMALRRMLVSVALSGSAARLLRREPLFGLAAATLAAAMASDASAVRAAAADAAASLVSRVLQPSPPSPQPIFLPAPAAAAAAAATPRQLPPPPRPESFAPLTAMAWELCTDPAAEVAAAAARLVADLAEASLAASAAVGPVSYSAWLPTWQDSIATAPPAKIMRPQQLAKLFELIFQSAAAAGGAAGVLLRKRVPTGGAPGGGGTADGDGDAAGRIEALQRLALGLVAAEPPLPPPPAALPEVAAAASAAATPPPPVTLAPDVLLRSSPALAWLAVQEGAKLIVGNRLRTHLGGPTQTLGALERMLQATHARLAQERRASGPAASASACPVFVHPSAPPSPSRDAAWLALELVGALERCVAHAAEGLPGGWGGGGGGGGGGVGGGGLPQPVLAFFAANKKVCEEWFARVRELLARTAALAGAHHAAAHHGLLRLRDVRRSQAQLLAALARERRAAAAGAAGDRGGAGGAAAAAPKAQGGREGAGPAEPAEAAAEGGPGGRRGGPLKQLQRRGNSGSATPTRSGATAPPGNAVAAAAAAAAAAATAAMTGGGGSAATTTTTAAAGGPAGEAADGGGAGGAANPGATVAGLEASLSRLAGAVVELLVLVGGALLAMGEPDGLQGLHAWALREFEPLLQGAHLPGASAVAAAAAAAAAGGGAGGAPAPGASPRAGSGGSGRAPTRGARSGSKGQHRDPFAWLQGLRLQAGGAYEQALVAYNAFLAPPPPPPAAPSQQPQAQALPGQAQAQAGPTWGPAAAALELGAGAQAFVAERVGECYAALGDWAGMQGLLTAFGRTAASEPAVGGWWPGAAAVIEARFGPLAAHDTAPPGTAAAELVPVTPGDATATLLSALRALERGAAASAAAPSHAMQPPPPARGALPYGSRPPLAPPPQPLAPLLLPQPGLAPWREAVGAELSRLSDRVRTAALAEPTTQRELLLQTCSLRAAARALDVAVSGGGGAPAAAAAAGGPWPGLLIARSSGAAAGGGIGAALLSADGGLQPAALRDVATVAALQRPLRAVDPAAAAAASRALALEHLRAAAAAANWGLAGRLVAAAAARAMGPGADGARAVLAVAHSLVSSSSGRLQPGQVVQLQLRALLPALTAPLVAAVAAASAAPPPPGRQAGGDADDMACALVTLSRWMLRASSAPLAAAAAAVGLPLAAAPPPPGFDPGWQVAADWRALCRVLLTQLATHHPTSSSSVPPPPQSLAHPAFAVPEALLQGAGAGALPAACACLRALQLSHASPRAWKAWADLLYRTTKEQRSKAASAAAAAAAAAAASGGGGVGGAGAAGGVAAAAAEAAAAGYGAAAVAYCCYLRLSYAAEAVSRPEDVLPVLLQVLHIVVRHSGPIEGLLASQLASVPPGAWAAVTPQLLAQLPGAGGATRRLLAALLRAVGAAAPSTVLYPAVVEVRAADAAAAAGAAAEDGPDSGSGSGSMVPELRALLADLGRARPGLLSGVELLVSELERLTVLWDERWAGLLAEVEVELSRRAVSLQAEAARVADDPSLSGAQRQALLASRYTTLTAPALLLLEKQLRATATTPAQTPHERAFAAAALPRLRAAAAALRDGAGVTDWAKPAAAWAPLRAAAAAAARQQRAPLPPMAQLSPRLAALAGSEVPMPGCHDGAGSGAAGSALLAAGLPPPPAAAAAAAAQATGGLPSLWPTVADAAGSGSGPSGSGSGSGPGGGVTVAGVGSRVVALPTKTRPKRVELLGSDGRRYGFLLKGREDLRMDERLMQLLRAIRSLLSADPAASARGLPGAVRDLAVTPLGPRAGLIQWVPATTSMLAVFRAWQGSVMERHAAMAAARAEGAAKAAAEGVPPPPELEPPPPGAASRPMDLFYATLVPALQDRGLSSATPRRAWPADVLRSVFTSLAAGAPRAILGRALWGGAGSAAGAWRRQQLYARSLGAMSMVGHLLGLGDRHLDNLLLLEGGGGGEGAGSGTGAAAGGGGCVLHIDYNCCWDKGAKLRVPEVVPFRLTQMLSTALGVGGLEGPFRAACELTLGCLRRRREALVGLADAILSDPGVDWAVEREDAAARQDMEAAVALGLFVSRADEAQRQLQALEAALPALLDGPGAVGALLAYTEAHAFAEAMRGAAAEAQTRVAAAKAALAAANRAEAEAGALLAAAAQESASLTSEAAALRGALPGLLAEAGGWAQQHAASLGVLRDGAFLEGPLGSCASWRARDAGGPLGLLSELPPGEAPQAQAQAQPLLRAVVGGDGSVLAQLPEELVISCHEYDAQAEQLLGSREAAMYDAIGALTQYGTIVRKLLPPSYPADSYHHRWAQSLAALAAGGLAMPAVAQAAALAPREPRPTDVATAWQALRGSQRLATAAAVVLAPGTAEAAAALAGRVAGARVLGRELAAPVAAAARALAEVQAQAAAALAAAAAAAAGGPAASTEALARQLTLMLGGGPQGPENAAASAATLAALVALVSAADGRARSVAARLPPPSPGAGVTTAAAAAVLPDLVYLGAQAAGLAAAVGAVSAVDPALRSQLPNGGGGAADGSLTAAAAAFSRWPELQQRLAADVVPDLAGQIHVSSGGSAAAASTPAGAAAGVPATPLAQAEADLQVLLRPLEETLAAARNAEARSQALAELHATYHMRAAELRSRTAMAAAMDDGRELAEAEAELAELDAAWASRDAVGGVVAAEAAAAAEAVAEALRRFYGVVLGPARLPADLTATAPAAPLPGGGEGWAEAAGGGGHAATAVLTAWWEAVTEAVAPLQPAAAGALPLPLRPLQRCIDVTCLVAWSVRAVQGLKLTAPPGSDGALAEAYGAVLPLLARRAGELTAAALAAHLTAHLPPLAAALAEAAEQRRRLTAAAKPGGAFPAASAAAGLGSDAPNTPELVPFTAFDPDLAGEGEALDAGGLEDDDGGLGGADGDGDGGFGDGDGEVGWRPYDADGDGNGDGDDAGAADGDDGYDLDLGLELDLDDGFGGGMADDMDAGVRQGSAAGAPPSLAKQHAAAAADAAASRGRAAAASPEEAAALVDRLAARAAAVAAAAAAAAVDPTAAAAAAAAESAQHAAHGQAHGQAHGRHPPTHAHSHGGGGGGAGGWAAGPDARGSRTARLQRLAAYEWLHEHHLLQALPPGDPRLGEALAHFFAAAATDPLQPSSRGLGGGGACPGGAAGGSTAAGGGPGGGGGAAPGRLALLTRLQAAVDGLPGVQGALGQWEAASASAANQVVALLRGAPEQFPVDTALAAQRAQGLLARRGAWLAEARAAETRVCQVAEALLAFEYSRQGVTLAPGGGAPAADGFAPHAQALARAEVLAALAGGEAARRAAVAEASERAAEGGRRAAEARYALEVAQYEEVAASSQLTAHLPQLVSRSLDLGPAAAEAEPGVRALMALLAGRLGPALRELTSVAAQHPAAADVASVAASVAGHYDAARSAAEALAEALPATTAALAAADAACPLPPAMATEVGFLSAQLVGGPAEAEATRRRALALLQHLAAPVAALQPVVHRVLELPRAVSQLRVELSALASAAASIAAAVQSKHLLPASAADEAQPGPTGAQPGQGGPQGQTPGSQTPPLPAGASAGPSQVADDASGGADGTSADGSGKPAGAAAAQQRLAAAAADHVQHHRSRRSAADEARRRAFAAGALRRFVAKLEGRDGASDAGGGAASGGQPAGAGSVPLSVADQVEVLVRQATSTERLAQMYEGWTAWI